MFRFSQGQNEALVRTFKKSLSEVKFSEPAVNCLKIIDFKKTRQLNELYIWLHDTVMWHWPADTLFWHLSFDHNITSVQYQVEQFISDISDPDMNVQPTDVRRDDFVRTKISSMHR